MLTKTMTIAFSDVAVVMGQVGTNLFSDVAAVMGTNLFSVRVTRARRDRSELLSELVYDAPRKSENLTSFAKRHALRSHSARKILGEAFMK